MTARSDWESNPYAIKALDFISHLTLIGDYSGERWVLEPWQREWIGRLYGTRNQDGTRQYNKVSLWLPRGLGKTQQAAGIALYQLFCGPPGQEIYAASCDRDKAGRLFKAAAQMIRADAHLVKLVDISDHFLRIKYKAKNTIFLALAADSDQGHSLAPSTLILDELHLWRHRSLYDALTSGFGKRKKGSRLEIQISTAGDRKEGLAWDLYVYARNVRDGIINDPEMLVRIFEATENDDWTDPEVWRKVMPCQFVDFDFIASECRLAQHLPHKQSAFKRLYLNIWTEDRGESWIAPAEWRECQEDYSEDELIGEPGVAALDLSSVRDLTSLTLFFYESKRCLSWSWLPAEGLAERADKDGVPYQVWKEAGHLYTTSGSRIVHSEVAERINEILHKFNCEKLVADPYSLHLIALHLDQEVERYPQSAGHLSPPAKWLESSIATRRIHHNGDPLLAWAMSNVVVEKDKYENISPSKGKSRKRIDPAVALVMAVGAWLGTHGDEGDCNDFYADDNKGSWLIDLAEVAPEGT